MICKIYTLRTSEKSGCIIIENEAGEIIASSGCEEGIPTLCTEFCQAWINNPLPEVEIWESDVLDITNAYTEEFGYLFTPKIENEEERYDSEDSFIHFCNEEGVNNPSERLENLWNSLQQIEECNWELCPEGQEEYWDGEQTPYTHDLKQCRKELYAEVYICKNQLPEIPSEIQTFTDMFGNVYNSSEACEEGELRHKLLLEEQEEVRMAEFYRENPTGGEHVDEFANSFQQMLVEEGLQRKNKGQFLDFINNEGEHFSQEVDKLMDAQVEEWEENYQSSQITEDMLEKMEHEARQNLRKHVLIKRKDLPKRVDFEMLVNSSHLIWNAAHLLGLGQDPNNEVITLGQEAVKNLELFLSLMSNPKFATKASFEIEKILTNAKRN